MAKTPSKKHAVQGKVLREDPLSLAVSYSDDDNEQLKSSLDVSPKNVQIVIGPPDNLVTINAAYPNRSAIVVEVKKQDPFSYRPRRGWPDETEAALSLTFVTPNMLRSRVFWKPYLVENVKQALIEQAERFRENSRSAILELNGDVQDEVVAKYQTITDALADDTRPVVEMLKSEVQTVASAFEQAAEGVEEMIRKDEFNMKQIVDSLAPGSSPSSRLREIKNTLMKSSQQLSQTVNKKLEALRVFPIKGVYSQTVTQRVQQVVTVIDDSSRSFTQSVRELKLSLAETVQRLVDKIREAIQIPDKETLRGKVRQLTHVDVDQLSDRINEALSQSVQRVQEIDLSPVTRVLESAQNSQLAQRVPQLVKHAVSQAVKSAAKTAQLVYDSLGVEQNAKDAIRSAVQSLEDAVKAQVKKLEESVEKIAQNPVIVYDPDQGVMVIEVPVPEVSSYVQDVKKAYGRAFSYVPLAA